MAHGSKSISGFGYTDEYVGAVCVWFWGISHSLLSDLFFIAIQEHKKEQYGNSKNFLGGSGEKKGTVFSILNTVLFFFKRQAIACRSCKVSIVGASKEIHQRMSDNDWRNMLKKRQAGGKKDRFFFSPDNSHHFQGFHAELYNDSRP